MLPFTLFAQSVLHRFDERIAFFQETGKLDSVRYYAVEKIRLAQAADSLAAWAWAQLDLYSSYADEDPSGLDCLDAAWAKKWREPLGSEECEPLMYLQANRGWRLFQQGRVWQAVQAYELARRWYEQFQFADFEAVGMIYKPLGNHYTRLGDNEKALAVFEKALTIGGDAAPRAGLYTNIGIAYWNAGNYPAADASFGRGLQVPGLTRSQRALLLGSLAQSQLDGGQAAQAWSNAMQAIRLFQAQSPPGEVSTALARARRTAANAALRLGRLAEATRLLAAARAGETQARELGKTETDGARLYLALNRPQDAIDAANRALSAVLPNFKPQNRAENPDAKLFYEENVLFEALSAKAEAAEALYGHTSDLNWLRCALACHDLAWQAEVQLRQVFQYHSSKLSLQGAAHTRETAAMRVARTLFEKTGQIEYLETGFSIAERSKAALLLEAVQDNLVRQHLAGSDPRFSQLAALRQSRSYFEKDLLLSPQSEQAAQWHSEADLLHTQIAALERAIGAAYPNLSRIRTQEQFLSLKTAVESLSKHETLLEYFVGDDFVDVFVLGKQIAPAWHRFPLDGSLVALNQQFTAFFANAHAILNDPAAYLQTAHEFYQKVMPREAASAEQLLIVSDGFLNFIPFEALLETAPEAHTQLQNAPYLIRRQAVRYAWSVATMMEQNQWKSAAPHYLLGIAPMCQNRVRGLPMLPDSRSEWQALPYGAVHELIDRSAVWDVVRQKAAFYQVLHFSTHADAGTRQDPHIELYDQSVWLPDLYALPLQANLVVLSACQTGLGEQQAGEGVMSLARAFAQSGAACVVSSLWTVNDRSTAQLFSHFYEKIGEGSTISAALRGAKLDYLNDASVGTALQSPYFWAGLVAVGADRSVMPPSSSLFKWVSGALAIVVLMLVGWFWRKAGPSQESRH